MDCRVHEIFLSLEGETTTAGFPAVFIRLAGCNLNCRWCDTPGARSGGTRLSIQAIVDRVLPIRAHHVTVTGGEPLCQEGCAPLMETLAAEGKPVQVETNGSLTLKNVPAGVRIITDVKTPSSGEQGSFLMDNIRYLKESDEVKFIIADENDYNFARDFNDRHLRGSSAVINFSPAHGSMNPDILAEMILRDGVMARMNIQLHKIIWGECEGKTIVQLD